MEFISAKINLTRDCCYSLSINFNRPLPLGFRCGEWSGTLLSEKFNELCTSFTYVQNVLYISLATVPQCHILGIEYINGTAMPISVVDGGAIRIVVEFNE